MHIIWIDKNAKISFRMDTVLEKENFTIHLRLFLGSIEQLAFKEFKFHKFFTYAFELRRLFMWDVLQGRIQNRRKIT